MLISWLSEQFQGAYGRECMPQSASESSLLRASATGEVSSFCPSDLSVTMVSVVPKQLFLDPCREIVEKQTCQIVLFFYVKLKQHCYIQSEIAVLGQKGKGGSSVAEPRLFLPMPSASIPGSFRWMPAWNLGMQLPAAIDHTEVADPMVQSRLRQQLHLFEVSSSSVSTHAH